MYDILILLFQNDPAENVTRILTREEQMRYAYMLLYFTYYS